MGTRLPFASGAWNCEEVGDAQERDGLGRSAGTLLQGVQGPVVPGHPDRVGSGCRLQGPGLPPIVSASEEGRG